MAYAGRTYSGLKTTFGLEWGRPVTLAGDVGGIWSRPEGVSPDEPRGLIVYLHGYGGTYTTGTSQLASSARRSAARGSGFYRLSLQGSFTLGGLNRTWNGPDSLLPLNTSYPWATSTLYALGDLRTANGNIYGCIQPGISASSGTGPSTSDAAIADGTCIWRCLRVGSTHDNARPDIDWIAGVGRTFGGVTLPMGVVREFIATSGLNIDMTRVWVAGYSTGGGLAYMLLRHHPDLFCGGVILSGVDCTGPNTDHNYAAPSRGTHLIHFHGTLDGQVNDEDVPPNASTAAVGNHPGQQTSVQQLMREMGWGPSDVVVDTGVTRDFTGTAGAETKIWAPSADVVDAKGNTIRHRMYQMVGDGHSPSLNNDAYREMTNFIDDNPRIP